MKVLVVITFYFLAFNSTSQTDSSVVIVKDECIDGVETQASFPGGIEEFQKWFSAEVVKIMTGTHLNRIKGTVQFVVNENGSVTDVKLLEISTDDLSKSIMQILERSPKWIPKSSLFGNYPKRFFKQRVELPFDIKVN